MQSAATGRLVTTSNANDSAPPEPAQPPGAVGDQALTQHEPGQYKNKDTPRTPGKAQSALPRLRSGAAAAEYGSRCRPSRAPAGSTASPWSSHCLQRGARSACRFFGKSHTHSGLPAARPNPSLKLTHYGRLCKPGPRQSYYRRVPGLQSLPPRAA